MATRNISPRVDGEGSLGRSGKKWGNIYADNGHIAGRNIAEDGAKLDAQATAIEQIRVSVGTPLVANSVLDMTDINKIYVYTGNEQGYTKGDWYYYNGTEWVSGGVYNSTAFETDKTLTIEGAAADAKAAGDWLRDIAVPVTALPEIPETAFANEYMKVVVDSEKHVLYGVRRDGSFYWQKGVPAHLIDKIHEIAEPTIENDEYLYVMLDTEGHVILGVKRDGSVDWQKGTPQHVIEACNPTMESDEYLYLIKDPDDRVIFAIRRDGSIDWQKGVPKPIQEKIFTDKIETSEFVQFTQDADGKLIEGLTVELELPVGGEVRYYVKGKEAQGGVETGDIDLLQSKISVVNSKGSATIYSTVNINSIAVYDVAGRLMSVVESLDRKVYDVELPMGVYMLQITTEDNVYQEKVVIK
jgi:hypothetical protein